MTVFDNLNTLSSPFESAVALGYFDGMHLAHRQIITEVLKHSKRYIPWVFTFTLAPDQSKNTLFQKPIMSTDERVKEIEKMGVQGLFIPPFNEIKNLTAEEFVENVLFKKMNAKFLACGYNFRFGKGNLGDVNLLKQLSQKHGVQLFVADEMTFKGKTLSSTYIRECLKNGNIENANLMLGAPYTITGEIVHGARLGSTLNFPTINQLLDTQKTQVKYGVYLSEVLVDNNTYPAVTNVGVKPTVNGNVPMAESHLIDFTGDLYGKYAAVKLINFLREETRFESLNELKTAVQNDIKIAKQLLKTAD